MSIFKDVGLFINTGAAVHCCATFGFGTGETVLDQLSCVGTESSLFDCPAEPVGMHNCFHSEDVGVTCTGQFW